MDANEVSARRAAMQMSRRRRAPPLRDEASSVVSGSAYALKPDQKINLEYHRRREVRPRNSLSHRPSAGHRGAECSVRLRLNT